MVKYLKVFGERCSGTNYITSLLCQNFTQLQYLDHTRTSPFGWKHDILSHEYVKHEMAKDTLFVLVVRDPYDWLRSFFHQPHHAYHCKKMSFSQFLKSPWFSCRDHSPSINIDVHPSGRTYHNVIEMRTEKIKALMRFHTYAPNCTLITYESVRDDPERFCSSIQAIYGLTMHSGFKPVMTYKNTDEPYQAKTYFDIDEHDMRFINSQIKWDLEYIFGYNQMSS